MIKKAFKIIIYLIFFRFGKVLKKLSRLRSKTSNTVYKLHLYIILQILFLYTVKPQQNRVLNSV